MALEKVAFLKQIEFLCDPQTKALTHVFAERVNAVIDDGAVIAQNNHRDSFAADSDEGRAILGETLASAVAGQQQAAAERDAALAEAAILRDALAEAQAQVNALAARVQGLLAERAPVDTPSA